MTKVMIWPDLYREQGHWMPCISLAKSLQDAGYVVEFMGIPDCASIVAPYAATYRTVLGKIYPPGHSSDDRVEPLGQRWKPEHLLAILDGELDSVFTGAGAPDLLVAGYFNALESLLIHYKYGVPLVTITTYLRHPDEDPAMLVQTKLAYMPKALVRKLIDGVSAAPDTMSIDDFVAPLEAAPELLPCPPQFDFTDDDWSHLPNVIYTEPMIVRVPLDGSTLPTNPSDVPTDKKLIFATAGSQVQDYEMKAKGFFKNLIAMMNTQGMTGHHLVLAVGPKLLAELQLDYKVDQGTAVSTLPKNVSLFDWVSQLDILKTADVVFTHGGLATIKESIWEGVPIIVVPHGKDQQDNALRVRRTGVGIAAEMTDLSPQQLRGLLTEATTSTWIKKRLGKLRGVFQAAEGAAPKPSVTAISAVVAP